MNEDPIGYFITCSCYGTWLPGDGRGWIRWRRGYQLPRPLLCEWTRERLREEAAFLSDVQRPIVESTIEQHCAVRGWELHEVNCRSNHVHVVVTAPDTHGKTVRDQFKTWCTRRLREHQRSIKKLGTTIRKHWWARGGSVRVIYDEDSLIAAIAYVSEAQEVGGSRYGSDSSQ